MEEGLLGENLLIISFQIMLVIVDKLKTNKKLEFLKYPPECISR
jgi:hypothetical protein